jgi:hypothetical protein
VAVEVPCCIATIDRPLRGSASCWHVAQGFTLDAKSDANVCGALCVLTLGCDGTAPAGLRWRLVPTSISPSSCGYDFRSHPVEDFKCDCPAELQC